MLLLQDREKERRRSKNPETMDEDDNNEVAEIKAAHIEESMKFAHRSVSDADIPGICSDLAAVLGFWK